VSTRDELLRAVGEAVRDKCRVAKGDAYGVGNSDLDAIIARVKSEYAQREPDSASEVVELRAEVARLKAVVQAAREFRAEIENPGVCVVMRAKRRADTEGGPVSDTLRLADVKDETREKPR